MVWYQAAKRYSSSSSIVAGMVPDNETLQQQQCRWYGTKQRNTAAAAVSLVW
jgi:hypothetical protein